MLNYPFSIFFFNFFIKKKNDDLRTIQHGRQRSVVKKNVFGEALKSDSLNKIVQKKNKAAGKSMVVKNDYKKNSENKRIMAQNDQDNITGTIKDNPSLLF